MISRLGERAVDTQPRDLLIGVRMSRMNAVVERWVRIWRHELLDRTLIWNQADLLAAVYWLPCRYIEQLC